MALQLLLDHNSYHSWTLVMLSGADGRCSPATAGGPNVSLSLFKRLIELLEMCVFLQRKCPFQNSCQNPHWEQTVVSVHAGATLFPPVLMKCSLCKSGVHCSTPAWLWWIVLFITRFMSKTVGEGHKFSGEIQACPGFSLWHFWLIKATSWWERVLPKLWRAATDQNIYWKKCLFS